MNNIQIIFLLFGSGFFLIGAAKNYEHFPGKTKVNHNNIEFEIKVEAKERLNYVEQNTTANEVHVIVNVLSKNTYLEISSFNENRDSQGKRIITFYLNEYLENTNQKLSITQDNLSVYPLSVTEFKKTEHPKIIQLKNLLIFGNESIFISPFLLHQIRMDIKSEKISKADIFFEGMDDPPQKWKVYADVRRALDACEVAAKAMDCTYEYNKNQLGCITIKKVRKDGIAMNVRLTFFMDQLFKIQVKSEPFCFGTGSGPFPKAKYAEKFAQEFLEKTKVIVKEKIKKNIKEGKNLII